jgi:hypothetical protein
MIVQERDGRVRRLRRTRGMLNRLWRKIVARYLWVDQHRLRLM